MMAVRGPSLVEVEILLAPAGKGSLCANTIQTSETLPATIALAQSRRNGFAIDIRAHPLPGGMPSVIANRPCLGQGRVESSTACIYGQDRRHRYTSAGRSLRSRSLRDRGSRRLLTARRWTNCGRARGRSSGVASGMSSASVYRPELSKSRWLRCDRLDLRQDRRLRSPRSASLRKGASGVASRYDLRLPKPAKGATFPEIAGNRANIG